MRNSQNKQITFTKGTFWPSIEQGSKRGKTSIATQEKKHNNRGVAQFGMCEASRRKTALGGSVPSPIAQCSKEEKRKVVK